MSGSQPEVSPAELAELDGEDRVVDPDITRVEGVELTVTVELGRVRMTIRDLLRMGEGTVVELDRAAGAPVDVRANGRLVARGDIVVADDELGVRITEIVGDVETP